MSFLDVGCGFGADIEYFTQHYHHVEAVGIDQSAGQIEEAKTKILGATFLVADVSTFDLDRQFDRILVRHVLHLVDNPQRAIDNVLRHLKPGGRAVFVLHSTRSQPKLNAWLDWFEAQTGITFTSSSDAFTIDHDAQLFELPNYRTTVNDAVAHVHLDKPDPYLTYIEGQKRWSRTPTGEELAMLLQHVRSEIERDITVHGHFEDTSVNGIITLDKN